MNNLHLVLLDLCKTINLTYHILLDLFKTMFHLKNKKKLIKKKKKKTFR